VKRGYVIHEASGRESPIAGTFIIGRTKDCGLLIEDSAASRRHMEITARENTFIWKDLGSTNGTMVNGSRMLAGELKDGDTIQIGETVMLFRVEEIAEETGGLKEDSRLFMETILDASGVAKPAPTEARTTALLEAVYTVANEIATNYEPCSLLNHVLSTTVRAINAQRGAVFIAGAAGDLAPCPVCNQIHCIRDGVLKPAEPGEIKISETVVRRVIEGGESVLYQDTDLDSAMNPSESILSLDLRSILCVPLRAKHGILGVLYVDTDRAGQQYSHDDLLLASAVGNSAGLALENAHMHQQILDKQRIEQEIATAWTIQEGFLIKDWDIADKRFDVYGETKPAKTVGGDFYDFVQPRPGVIGVMIGDVSGKGVPAALTMAQLLAEFRLLARDIESPTEVLKHLNTNLVRRSRRGLFCTVCYFSLDLRTGLVTAGNAGHNTLLRIGADGPSLLAEATGPPLGILPEAQWHDVSFEINVGETLLMYTDGILEARSGATTSEAGGEPVEYDTASLLELAPALYGVPAREVVEKVEASVREFAAPLGLHDDCTMIATRYCSNEY